MKCGRNINLYVFYNNYETIGVAIGPGTSNIVTEIILHPIDQKLRNSKYEFIRYIDDYTAFFDTYENAEEFIRVLGTELSKYGLLLNIKKTEIKNVQNQTNSKVYKKPHQETQS